MRVRYAVGMALVAALLAPAGTVVKAQTGSVLKKMAPPLRGEAELGYMISAKRDEKTKSVITTFQVKNLSATNSIVGLQITQYWYDKAGNALQGTGDRQRLRAPLQPGEVATITLTSAIAPGMTAPQHKFEHQNGQVRPRLLKADELKS